MQAYVYKSRVKQDTFVYLATRDGFDRLPPELLAQLGSLTFVLEVALTPERRLALADATQVRLQLAERGYYLQFPPTGIAPERADG